MCLGIEIFKVMITKIKLNERKIKKKKMVSTLKEDFQDLNFRRPLCKVVRVLGSKAFV